MINDILADTVTRFADNYKIAYFEHQRQSTDLMVSNFIRLNASKHLVDMYLRMYEQLKMDREYQVS
jgi:hypothetical protein